MPHKHAIRYRATLTQAIAVIVGIVIGAGLFQTPPLVAANTSGQLQFIALWLFGGLLSFAGALCYAELATTYPHEGGDYRYLRRAYGETVSFLFVWSRMTVIQTGSIALLAYILGTYATAIVSLGPYSDALYAAGAVCLLTVYNCTGIRRGFSAQVILLGMVLCAILVLSAAGFTGTPQETVASPGGQSHLGRALIFVLLTFGGWTEAAFISRELVHSPSTMVRALFASIGIITAVYLLANLSFLHYFGFHGLQQAPAIGAAMMEGVFGSIAANVFSVFVAIVALSSMNGVMMTGARSNFALGRDYRLFGRMASMHPDNGNPMHAYLIQAGIALTLIGIGAFSRSGFEMMVDYTAPVFWLFITLSAGSVVILRTREPETARPFSVPGYPLTPIVFMVSSAYLCYSGIMYAGSGGILGILVLVTGLIALRMAQGGRSAAPDDSA